MLEEYQNSDVLNSTFETSLSKTFLLLQIQKGWLFVSFS